MICGNCSDGVGQRPELPQMLGGNSRDVEASVLTMSRGRPTSMIVIFVMMACVAITLSQDVVFPEERSNVCVLASGEVGECTDIYSCLPVLKTFREQYPVHCGFIKFTPIVCCPISNEI